MFPACVMDTCMEGHHLELSDSGNVPVLGFFLSFFQALMTMMMMMIVLAIALEIQK